MAVRVLPLRRNSVMVAETPFQFVSCVAIPPAGGAVLAGAGVAVDGTGTGADVAAACVAVLGAVVAVRPVFGSSFFGQATARTAMETIKRTRFMSVSIVSRR